MKELETLYLNKTTLNTAYIFFDDTKKVKDYENTLKSSHFHYTKYIIKKHYTSTIFGFKIFGIKRRIIELATIVKGVID